MRAASWRAGDTRAETGNGVLNTGDGAGNGVLNAGDGAGSGVLDTDGGAERMLGGSGRTLVVADDGAAEVGLERTGAGGGCWLGRSSGVRLRCGMGGGLPGGRDGSKLELAGRGGSDTGRGGKATGRGATGATATDGSVLPAPARFSLSLAVPSSSPMEALCADSSSIAQIAMELSKASARSAGAINASSR